MHFISFRINKTKNWIKENKNLPIIGIGGSVRCIEKILRNHAFDDIDILVDYYMISYRNINSLFNIVKKLNKNKKKKILEKGEEKEKNRRLSELRAAY